VNTHPDFKKWSLKVLVEKDYKKYSSIRFY